MSQNEKKYKEIEKFIYLIKKFQNDLNSNLENSEAYIFSEDELKKINEELKAINYAFIDAIKNIELIRDLASAPLFDESQICIIQNALIDELIDEKEIRSITMKLKKLRQNLVMLALNKWFAVCNWPTAVGQSIGPSFLDFNTASKPWA